MNPKLRALIPAVISFVNERGSYVTKTKLLKLLYLIDVESFRSSGCIVTGLAWKFFHLGPWATEFDTTIQQMVLGGTLIETQSTNLEYDTRFFRTQQPHDLHSLFSSLTEETPVRNVLNVWAEKSTGEILDFVYFHTEPMEHGIRNQPLDFSYIRQETPERYERPSSGIAEKEIRRKRREFQDKLNRQRSESRAFPFTAPRYDQEFEKALEKIEAAET